MRRSQDAGVGLATLLNAGLNVVPAALVVLGVGTLTFGVWPRAVSGVTYGLIAWSFLAELIGGDINASHWILDTSLFHQMSGAPAISSRLGQWLGDGRGGCGGCDWWRTCIPPARPRGRIDRRAVADLGRPYAGTGPKSVRSAPMLSLSALRTGPHRAATIVLEYFTGSAGGGAREQVSGMAITSLDRVSAAKAPGSPPASATDARARALGLPSATALVIGSIIGTGVFTMPAVMAGAGTSSLLVLGVIAVGALLLGVMFGQLTKRIPSSDGGLYAYSRHEFGDFAGYLTAWCYWITAWAGNAAIVSSWVLYVESLFDISNPSAWTNFGIALTGLWVPAAINLVGARQMAWFQNVTVVLKFLPLLVVGIVGWFFVKVSNFGPFNASGGSLYSAIGIAAGVALFSFIGVECASIAAGRVQNPRRNVGRASILGTAASGLFYLAVTAAVMGLVSHNALNGNGAPFVDAFQTMFGHATWVGKLVAGTAVVSGIGALNGWTLVTAEMPYAAAKDGLFVPQFAKTFRDGTPWFGIIVSTIVASALMGFAYSGHTGSEGVHVPGRPVGGHGRDPVLLRRLRPAGVPGLAPAPGQRLGPGPGSLDRDRERPLLDVGDVRLGLPGGLPGDAAAAHRDPDLRVPQGSPRTARRGSRADRIGRAMSSTKALVRRPESSAGGGHRHPPPTPTRRLPAGASPMGRLRRGAARGRLGVRRGAGGPGLPRRCLRRRHHGDLQERRGDLESGRRQP